MRYIIDINHENGQFESRLEELKVLFDQGVTYNMFWALMHNLHNGASQLNRFNELDLQGWVQLYANSQIEVSEEIVELVFEYVRRYYPGILRKSSHTLYRQLLIANISSAENPFGMELIVLNSFEV